MRFALAGENRKDFVCGVVVRLGTGYNVDIIAELLMVATRRGDEDDDSR